MRVSLTGLVLIAACSAPAPQPTRPGDARSPATAKADNPLVVTLQPRDFADNPRLLSRLLSGPHGYFRFINREFLREVCTRFAAEAKTSPSVNLHGDAHVEQYAVTDLGRGLTDFDDASRGPALLDLVRFRVSLRLAAAANGWSRHAPSILRAFHRGYRQALARPDIEVPLPTVARRFLASFTADRRAAIESAIELMEPLDFPLAKMQTAIDGYAAPLQKSSDKLAPGFFRIKKAGYLRVGIGSALDTKYLVLVEGPTAGPGDDVVLELKEVRNLDSVPCLELDRSIDPFRVLVGSARIAYQPFRYLGYTRWDEQTFWVHAWTDNYFQVAIHYSFTSAEELEELAFDVGVQLGRGHPYLVATPLDAQLRADLVRDLDALSPKLERETEELAKLTEAAWRVFSRQLAHH